MLALDDAEEIARLRSVGRPPGGDSGVRKPEIQAPTCLERVAFAGLELELGGLESACQRLRRAALGRWSAASGAITAGTLTPDGTAPEDLSSHPDDTSAPKFAARCRLQMVPPPAARPSAPPSGLGWEWWVRGGELVTRWGAAQVWRENVALEDERGFAGRAWLDDDARAPHHVLGGLAVMLSHRLGGGVFHAASVELDGGVVAFVGPSGAGKSTACRHLEGAPLVSVDRLLVLPLASRWLAHPLPGGTPPIADPPNAPPRWRPLMAVLRVRQSANGTVIRRPSRALAVTLLRQSTFQSGLAPSAEHELLEALEGLVQHVPVAELEFCLGASLKPLLRRWLNSLAEERP